MFYDINNALTIIVVFGDILKIGLVMAINNFLDLELVSGMALSISFIYIVASPMHRVAKTR